MEEEVKVAPTGRRIRVKFAVLGRQPKLCDISEGTTVGQLLKDEGLEDWETTIGTRAVGTDHILKDGETVLLKQRLQGGDSA